MTFHDLPDGWPSLSLTDRDLALDVVDLFLGHFDRLRNSALVILCDESGRVLQPLVVNDIDWHMPAAERERLFRFLEGLDVPQVVVAVSAARPVSYKTAQRWLRTASMVLTEIGVRLIGFYCADADGVWEPAAKAA